MVLVRARCGCSDISKRRGVARRSCSAGLPVLLLLLTQSDSTALDARDNISIYSIAPIPFISKEAPTRRGTNWTLPRLLFR